MLESFRSLTGRLFRSLASRIGFFVFAATLASALAVAGTSALAVRAFLRGKVEERIPAAVRQAHDRLDLWYAQRALDVEIFAHSGIVVDGLARLTRAGRLQGDPRVRAEVEQYLGYVREDLPLYTSIFALDTQGREIARVGVAPALEPRLEQHFAGVEEASISGVLIARDGGAVQVVSAPVSSLDGRRAATLHAVVPLLALQKQLAASAAESAGRLLVLDAAGALVASSEDDASRAPVLPKALLDALPGEVHAYQAVDGVRVVGSALPFARLKWRLVFEGDYGTTFAPIGSILQRMVRLSLGIVLVLSAIAFAIARYMIRPLHVLSDCAVRLRDGEAGVALPVATRDDEVGILTRSFGEMVDSLTRANEALAQLATTDGLTKIHNHRYFQDELARAVRRSERIGAPLALVLLDIDDFKALNDRHGHAVGDSVLEQLARILANEVRSQDLVARYGGEEFAILAPDSDLDAALALAEKLCMAVHRQGFRCPMLEQPVTVTVSIGVATYRGDRQRFFVDADRALYAAKRAGKDCVMAAHEA